MSPTIVTKLNNLRNYKYAWDSTGTSPVNNFEESPLEPLLYAIKEFDVEVLQYLLYHSATRSLCMWEVHCAGKQPRTTLEQIKKYLLGQIPVNNLTAFISPPEPCMQDCRYGEIMGAAEAIAYASAFFVDEEPMTAVASVQGAFCAFDQVGLTGEFTQWFFDVAVPVAFEKRFMSAEELTRYMTHEYAISILEDMIGC